MVTFMHKLFRAVINFNIGNKGSDVSVSNLLLQLITDAAISLAGAPFTVSSVAVPFSPHVNYLSFVIIDKS